MNAFTFGDSNLIVQGIMEQTMYDPTTGDIVGYDTLATEGAIDHTYEINEIRAGFNNPIAGIIPHSAGLSGTYTSSAFSLRQRALATGGTLSFNGVTPVVETITATGSTLTVTRTPAKSYGQPASDVNAWCYVRAHNATSYSGINYGVDLTTKEVQGFSATTGTQYDVFYFTANASSEVFALPDTVTPAVVTIWQKYGVYAKQNNSASQSTLAGVLNVVITRAMLRGNAGLNANQTTNATTDYSWTALTPTENIPSANECGMVGDPIAYYVFTPCGDATQSVQSLVVLGGGVTVEEGSTVQIPVKYVMPDNTIVQPEYTDLTYAVTTGAANCSVSLGGVVSGTTAGTALITITVGELSTTCNVTVTAA